MSIVLRHMPNSMAVRIILLRCLLVTDICGSVFWKQRILWTTCSFSLVLGIFLGLEMSFNQGIGLLYYSVPPKTRDLEHGGRFRRHEYFDKIQKNWEPFQNQNFCYLRTFLTSELLKSQKLFNLRIIRILHFRIFWIF